MIKKKVFRVSWEVSLMAFVHDVETEQEAIEKVMTGNVKGNEQELTLYPTAIEVKA